MEMHAEIDEKIPDEPFTVGQMKDYTVMVFEGRNAVNTASATKVDTLISWLTIMYPDIKDIRLKFADKETKKAYKAVQKEVKKDTKEDDKEEKKDDKVK